MPVDLYQPFTNRVTGETFRCLSSTEEAYTTEWIVQPGGFVPFEHVHLAQDETFRVLEGELQAVINGRTQVIRAGQSITVLRGQRQTARNNSPTEVLRCVLQYRPALDSYGAFQCFGGLTLDGSYGRSGVVSPAKMLYLMEKAKTQSVARPALIPTPVFRLLMKFFYVFGSLAGWEKLYRKYVG
jgi:mannose-6-phosphate isomerase-like protein (cupin superfamily)